MDVAADDAAAEDIERGDHAPVPERIADKIVAAAQTGPACRRAQIEALRELQGVVLLQDRVELPRQDDFPDLLAQRVRFIAERGEIGAAAFRGIQRPRGRKQREKERRERENKGRGGRRKGESAPARM